ncbi:MAG TPA: PA2169 family four-helix-bundle protein [Chitinophagaceae bacterium]|nr:PA2169 family four-helix-bundle protein [Chitinophagaceae bacterium]
METPNAHIVEVLNDLIAINNDRVKGYERALKELKNEDMDLKPLFLSMIDESRDINITLGREVEVYKGEIDTDTSTRGKLYMAWMSIKAAFTGNDRHTLLENCEVAEDAAQQAYQRVIDAATLPEYLLEMIYDQQQSLRVSHNEIKVFRDNAVHA